MFYIVLFQMCGCAMLDGSVTLLFLLALHYFFTFHVTALKTDSGMVSLLPGLWHLFL
jgi:hypothetical protein